jgi:hypothetical protein
MFAWCAREPPSTRILGLARCTQQVARAAVQAVMALYQIDRGLVGMPHNMDGLYRLQAQR